MSTIFALATAPGRSAIAVVRISGPQTHEALKRVAGDAPPPRQARLRTLHDPTTGEVLDHALVVWFPAPHSFTGEDQAELHLHGGYATVSATLAALISQGLELAAPGAFTRRAFENGKVDLVGAEAIADLVDAETDAQRRQALSQLGGAAVVVQERWRTQLISAMSLTEASIDFADESMPDTLLKDAHNELSELKQELLVAISDLRGERIRDGFHIAIIGEPNAGKSSLLNALVARNASIVTKIPGTTRDVVEVPLVVEGYRVIFADTAGLREAADEIEAEGIRRAQCWASSADLRLFVVDRSRDVFPEQWLIGVRTGDVVVLNKQDLPLNYAGQEALRWATRNGVAVEHCEAETGNVSGLIERVSALTIARLSGSEPPIATRSRHRELLTSAAKHIDRALDPVLGLELFAENLRLAARCLERIVGRVDTEQVLEKIFSAFCIGK